MLDQSQCPACSSASREKVHEIVLQDRFPRPEKALQSTNDYHRNWILFEHVLERSVEQVRFEFFRCRDCGLIYFSPRPTEDDLAVKYRLVAELGDTEGREELRRLVDQRERRAEGIRRFVEAVGLSRDSGRLLDVGGADGHCLAAFDERWSKEILDFEDRQLWPGTRKIGDSLDDLTISDEFDLAICNHTLEHIPRPQEFLSRIKEHVVPEGLVYVEVPLGCAGEIFEVKNFLTHVNFFSTGSLGHLLESTGLRVERVEASPVLSRKRFLPVCRAVARRVDSRNNRFEGEAYRITVRESRNSMEFQVFRANLGLVLRNPARYLRAFTARALRYLRRNLP